MGTKTLKTLLFTCFLGTWAWSSRAQSPGEEGDTLCPIIQGVRVCFVVEDNMFPYNWYDAPINGHASSLAPDEIIRTEKAIKRALRKYPQSVLDINLWQIYALRDLWFYETLFGGTNTTGKVYITNNGLENDYTSSYIEKTIHHEFSSILLNNYETLFNYEEWNEINGTDFVYHDKLGGVESLKNGTAGTNLIDTLNSKGFLTEYSMSTLENDFNMISESLFCPDREFWKSVRRHEKLRKKVDLVIEFYSAIHPQYTKAFFEGLKE